LDQITGDMEILSDFLGVLGTDNEAVAAEDTVLRDDVRLVVREADLFHRTVPDAFVAAFTIGFLELEII